MPKLTPVLDTLMNVDAKWNTLAPSMRKVVRKYAHMTHDADTKRCYEISVRQWIAFCGGIEHAFPAKAEQLTMYAASLADSGLSPYTIRNKLIVIATIHRANNWNNIYTYEVRTLLRAIMKASPIRRSRMRPIRLEHLHAIYEVIRRDRNRVRAIRNWAMVLFGFWGALRRSEIAGVTLESLELSVEGLTYYIARSKGDPYGSGQVVCLRANARLDICPVHAVAAWLRVARIGKGPIFREITAHGHIGAAAITGDTIARVVKDYIEAIGLDSTLYGAHSLRRGWASYAFQSGSSMTSIQRHLRHGSLKNTRDYVDGPSPGDYNLSRKAGA